MDLTNCSKILGLYKNVDKPGVDEFSDFFNKTGPKFGHVIM